MPRYLIMVCAIETIRAADQRRVFDLDDVISDNMTDGARAEDVETEREFVVGENGIFKSDAFGGPCIDSIIVIPPNL